MVLRIISLPISFIFLLIILLTQSFYIRKIILLSRNTFNKLLFKFNTTMVGILELLISQRNKFIYFAICISIPSVALYVAEIIIIIRHKKFHSSFFALFVIRAIPVNSEIKKKLYVYT